MANPTKAVWHWFFPKELYVPICVHRLLEFVYPGVDWDRVTFHEGWPHVLGLGDHKGLTLPHSFKPGRIRVYFKEGAWDPCSCDGLGLIVHEGFHVLQMQNILFGASLGVLSPTTMLYLACWAEHGFSYDDHPAEQAAYKVAGKPTSIFDSCCAMQPALPCDCGCMPPSLDEAALQAFENDCSKVVQTSNGTGFWTQLAECTPGFETLIDWAKGAFNGTCRSDLSWAVRWFPCIFGAILAGILFVVAGLWYVIWFALLLVAAVVLFVLDVVVNVIGGIVSGVVGLGEAIWDGITSPFSEIEGNIWYTSYDGTSFEIPDVLITKDGHTRTKRSPSVARHQSSLYAAYKSRDNEDIWYTIFDGTNWLDQDIKVTKDGRTRTSTDPALAAYANDLYMAYRASDSSDLWYNVFDGTNWLDQDVKITKDGKTRTSHSPSLAVFNNELYMAYKAASGDHLWYTIFDGTNWLDEDIEITKDDRTRTSDSPSLAVFNNELYMAYKAATGDHIWYTIFDGTNWLDEDIEITKDGRTRTSAGPSLVVFGNRLYMFYRASSGEDIWYNVFDGVTWRDEDCKVTQEETIRTGTRPAAAELNALLYLVYRGAG